MGIFDLFRRIRSHEEASSVDEDVEAHRIAEQVNPTMMASSAPQHPDWYCRYCVKCYLSTIVHLEHLCYTRTINIVLPPVVRSNAGAWISLYERNIMDTVAHHAHNGNPPEKRCIGPCQRVLPDRKSVV